MVGTRKVVEVAGYEEDAVAGQQLAENAVEGAAAQVAVGGYGVAVALRGRQQLLGRNCGVLRDAALNVAVLVAPGLEAQPGGPGIHFGRRGVDDGVHGPGQFAGVGESQGSLLYGSAYVGQRRGVQILLIERRNDAGLGKVLRFLFAGIAQQAAAEREEQKWYYRFHTGYLVMSDER